MVDRMARTGLLTSRAPGGNAEVVQGFGDVFRQVRCDPTRRQPRCRHAHGVAGFGIACGYWRFWCQWLGVDLGAEPQLLHCLLVGAAGAGGYVDADVTGSVLD